MKEKLGALRHMIAYDVLTALALFEYDKTGDADGTAAVAYEIADAAIVAAAEKAGYDLNRA